MSTVLGLVLVAASVGACRQRDDIADGFPDGACVNFSGSSDGDNATIGNAECSGPHTHVVVAWVGGSGACHAGSDAQFATTEGTLCLRADPGPTATP